MRPRPRGPLWRPRPPLRRPRRPPLRPRPRPPPLRPRCAMRTHAALRTQEEGPRLLRGPRRTQ
ncbi:hypothetical protein C1876_04700 [Eggerthella sinensis]|uniref:Uncharacterized protein n=1 Tax=Eggerthella sinensis TaxID=242230 RepID=A0ABX9HKU9_9ACTN|nr:hypothetical protein C1876_04700 [Eggerthella sinensis]